MHFPNTGEISLRGSHNQSAFLS